MSLTIFEIQSAAAADGVYNCYKQKLLASGFEAGHGDKFADFDTVAVEVLNLIENDTISEYERALALHDRMAAWEVKDDDGSFRWIGIPITPSVRRAKTTQAAGNSTSIMCNLIENDGETEIVSGLGSDITVYFSVTINGNLNEAVPRLDAGDYVFVQNISGRWWCVAVFQKSEDCICNS
ncbi:MAG: hypothetical protein ACE5HX_04415 [bacterium]